MHTDVFMTLVIAYIKILRGTHTKKFKNKPKVSIFWISIVDHALIACKMTVLQGGNLGL